MRIRNEININILLLLFLFSFALFRRILAVETADEFYSIMAVLTREMMEFGIADTSEMVSIICNMEAFPFPSLESLRENYIYNIRPLNLSINQLKKGVVSVLNSGMNIIDEDNNLWRFGLRENWIQDQFAVATFTVNSANSAETRIQNRKSMFLIFFACFNKI